MTTSPAFAYVLVSSPNQLVVENDQLEIKSRFNVNSVSITETVGTYQIEFANVFSDPPVVTVTHFYNNADWDNNNLWPITDNHGFGGGELSDNAVGVVVWKSEADNYFCYVRLGNSDTGYWRSFGLSAIGPGMST